MGDFIDLHIHTNKSDGIFSPIDIVNQAKETNLKAISITDHDTLDGYYDALDIAEKNKIELIPGIELSCEAQEKDIHILGYFIDGKNEEFVKYLEDMRAHRKMRIYKITEKLSNLSIDISPESILDEIKNASPGRLHVARKMVEKGKVKSIYEAFAKYIGENSPAYVKKKKISVKECIRLIHNIGGIAVLAHPGTYRKDHLISEFKELGLDGIEVYHPEHQFSDIRKYQEISKNLNLFVTGGSDFHGLPEDKREFGRMKIPYNLLEILRKSFLKTI